MRELNSVLREKLSSLDPEARNRLMERLRKERGISGIKEPRAKSAPATPIREEADGVKVYPTGPGQDRMLILHEFADGIPLYNTNRIMELAGPLDVELLESGIRQVIRRHDSLRTTYQIGDQSPCQLVHPELPFTLKTQVLDDIPRNDRRTELTRRLRSALEEPFDLEKGPVIRVHLYQLEPELHVLQVVLHHIAIDQWSATNLFQELSEIYSAGIEGRDAKLRDLPIQFVDYCEQFNKELQSEIYEKQFQYWDEQFKKVPPELELPVDRQSKGVFAPEGERIDRPFEREFTDKILALGKKERVTLFMVVLAALKAILHKYSGQTDIVIGIPIASRLKSEYENMLGCFINTLALRTDLSGDPTFSELLQRVRQTVMEAFDNQEVPFEHVVRRLKLDRQIGQAQLFRVHLNVKDAFSVLPEFSGLEVSMIELATNTAKFDLSFTVETATDGWQSSAEFSTSLFDTTTIERIYDEWMGFIEKACDNPEHHLSQLLDTISPASSPKGASIAMDPTECGLLRRIDEQAILNPTAIAVRAGDREITYRQLLERANQLGHRLKAAGVGVETVVGLCIDRSIEMLVGLLGVLKAGGAYLPLDPDSPYLRMARMLDDSGTKLILSVAKYSSLFNNDSRDVWFVDDSKLFEGLPSTSPENDCRPDNLMYVLYTSGSTGTPKGVMVEHRNLENYLSSIHKLYPFSQGNYGMVQPLTADTTQTLLLTALIHGGCLDMIPRDTTLDASAMQEHFGKYPVDFLKITPAHLGALLEEVSSNNLLPAKLLIVGGEAFPVSLLRTIAKRGPSCRVWNHYGPTETTVGVLVNQLHLDDVDRRYPESTLPLGMPIDGVSIHVMDETGRTVDDGERGELMISGPLVTRGYLNHPDLTNEVFLPELNGLQYKSGDIVCRLPDCAVKFFGRKDHQVKIRGQRIELGEIEAVISEHPKTAGQAVVIRGAETGHPRIDGYYVAKPGVDLETSELIGFLKDRLTSAMIPSTFTRLESLPRTPMGKLDRKALPEPDAGNSDPVVRPDDDHGQTEDFILSSCREILGTDDLTIDDNFFSAGGHSLQAMRLINRIRNWKGADLPIRILLDHENLRDLAKTIDSIVSITPRSRGSNDSIIKGDERDYPSSRGIQGFFEDQVARTPRTICMEMGDHYLTYLEVERRANQLAHKLVSLGVCADQPVGIFMDRSVEMIHAVLGILKAGGACLPLDSGFPTARINDILSDADPKVILIQSSLEHKLPHGNWNTLKIGDRSILSEPEEAPSLSFSEEQLAYVLYTSGSTGKPKGVQVPHRTLLNLIDWQLDSSSCAAGDTTLQFASLGFDVSFQEIFSTFGSGGILMLVEEALRTDLPALANLIAEKEVKRLFLPYAILDLMAEELYLVNKKLCIEEIITAGEQLKVTDNIRKLFHRLDGACLVNQYGPTETHVVTAHSLEGDAIDWPVLPPIGLPVSNTTIYLLDENGEAVAEGETGEIAVGGASVARGYLGNKELTGERFISSPWDDSDTLYLTGDLATVEEDGTLQFHGRNDSQVKISGYRIEPAEIESHLMQMDGVAECSVIPVQDSHGQYSLRAFVIGSKPGGMQSSMDLRDLLKKRLPEHMIPGRIQNLERFPLNANGKVDRSALLALKSPQTSSPAPPAIASGSTIDVLGQIWMEVLDLESIEPDQSFFDLGGHSLLAVKVISRIRERIGYNLPYRELFEHPTLSDLSIRIDLLKSEKTEDPGEQAIIPEIPVDAVGEFRYPVSFAQQRLWFIDRFDESSVKYNINHTYRIKGYLNIKFLEQAVATIISRHDTLRTRFEEEGGELYQVVRSSVDLPFEIVDLSRYHETEREKLAAEALLNFSSKPFSLGSDTLIRVLLLKLNPSEYVFSSALHHIISDGWSTGIYFKELRKYYSELCRGESIEPDPLPIQYKDYSKWQREWFVGEELERQINYWREYLKDYPTVTLPYDKPRPEIMNHSGERYRFSLPESLAAKIDAFNRKERVTPFMTFMSAYNVLLAKYSGQDDIVVGTPIANRQRTEFEHLIGFFVNTLVFRTNLSGGVGFRELISRVRESAIDNYQHQDLPFEKLVQELNPSRELNQQPLFQVMFAMQNTPREPFQLMDLEVGFEPVRSITTHFDLGLHIIERGNTYEGRLEYSTELFHRTTLIRMFDDFTRLLEYLVGDPDQPVLSFEITESTLVADDTQPIPVSAVQLTSDQERSDITPKHSAELDSGLIEIWQEVLGVQDIGLTDNFFALGGHSLSAAKIVNRIREQYAVEIRLKKFFSNPTIAGCLGEFSIPEYDTLPELKETASPSEPESYQTTFIQDRIWFLEKLESGSAKFHMKDVLEIHGELQVAALEQALNRIIERHATLRTAVRDVEGSARQFVLPQLQYKLEVEMMDKPPADDPKFEKLLLPYITQPFDLEKAPLFRSKLIKFSDKHFVYVFLIHHLISDGVSMQLLRKELAALYNAFACGKADQLDPIEHQYTDFAEWQRETLKSKRLQQLEHYWSRKMQAAPPMSLVRQDHQRTSADIVDAGFHELDVDPELTAKLNQTCREKRVTVFMFLLAVFKLLLMRHTGQKDIVLGTPVANRNRKEYESLIGCFLSTLPLRTQIAEDASFDDLLVNVRESVLEAFEHEDLPFERLVEILKPDRSLAHSPVFQILFNYLTQADSFPEWDGLDVDKVFGTAHSSKYELTIYSSMIEGELKFFMVYDAGIFDPQTISTLMDQYVDLLGQVAVETDKKLDAYSLRTPHDQSILPDPEIILPPSETVPVVTQFREVALRRPEQVALRQNGKSWSYSELEKASRVVSTNLNSAGLKPGHVVMIEGERTFDFVAGVLGILRCGGALFILNRDLPEERQRLLVREAGAEWHICFGATGEKPYGLKTVVADQSRDVDTFSEDWIPNPDSPAYIFFTSGTTGVPKAILGNHKGLSHFITWERNLLEIGEGDRIAQLTGYSFDVILRDLFLPLTSGASLCLPDEESEVLDPEILDWMNESGITIIHTVPSVVRAWTEGLRSDYSIHSLRYTLFAGEPLPRELVLRWRNVAGEQSRIFNLYGTTETTLAKCFYHVPVNPSGGIQPIGAPMPDTQVLILNEEGQQCGLREPGEIVIRTPFVSSGYLNGTEPELSRFRRNPFRDDVTDLVYSTGDIGCLDPDGRLRIFGRKDDQVKIRGIRIEPAEVSAAIMQTAIVDQCHVQAVLDENQETRLAAWVILSSDDKDGLKLLRDKLKARLPDYMVPVLVPVQSFRLNPNGKIDRKALPRPDFGRVVSTEQIVLPRNETEKQLAEIWKEVLKLTEVGVRDSFFDIGGHSLLAMRVLTRLKNAGHTNINLRALFEFTTIESLAAELSGTEIQQAEIVEQKPPSLDQHPVSFGQFRFWFLDRFSNHSTNYDLSGCWLIEGVLYVTALEKAVAAIVYRHESFRTRFAVVDGEPFQQVDADLKIPMQKHDLAEHAYDPDCDEVKQLISETLLAPFNLEEFPLFRTCLYRLSDTVHIFGWSCPHILSDGWSVGLFRTELKDTYAAFAHDPEHVIEAPAIGYTEYASWQRKKFHGEELERQLNYWTELLKSPTVLELPTDYPRPQRQSFNGGRLTFTLPDSISVKLTKLTRQTETTPFMVLMSAFQVLLSRYSGQDDILVGTPVANRNSAEFEKVIGFFVNTLVYRGDFSVSPTFKQLIEQIREQSIESTEYQDLPFDKIVEKLNPERNMRQHPVFQVIFALQNAGDSVFEIDDLQVKPYGVSNEKTRFDLELHMSIRDGVWRGNINYCSDLFSHDRMELMSEHYIRLLDCLLGDPEQLIATVPLMGEEERNRVIAEWNPEIVGYPRDSSIPALFDKVAAEHLNAVAIEESGESMDYETLLARSNQLANLLLSKDLSPGNRVGVCMERSIDLVVSQLAILKAGASYVPLARDYPIERVQFMVEDAGIQIVLVDGDQLDELQLDGLMLINPSECRETLEGFDKASPNVDTTASDPAYIIYTSGSTGQPKGSVIPHRGVVRLVKAQDYADFSPGRKFLFMASPSFDAATFEVWGPLLNGGTCVVYNDRYVDTPVLKELIQEHKVECAWLTAGLFNLIVDSAPEVLGELKHVLTGGEALSPKHVRQARSLYPELRLTNGYGPTESTTFACTYEIESVPDNCQSIPIGRPIASTSAYILDERMQPVPAGTGGELYLGGDGLAVEYLNQPDLTAERFVDNPFAEKPGERLYRTGDICRHLPDGLIDFIGRRDNQVKVRGFRIELGEVESAILKHRAIDQCVVVARKDNMGVSNLYAYCVAIEGSDRLSTSTELEEFLAQHLPAYAIPQHIILIDEMPLTPNGKVDHRALPDAADHCARDTESGARRANTPTEAMLIGLVQNLFERQGIRREDNFFHLGGHSLMATRLLAEVEKETGCNIPIAALFEVPTLEGLAARIDDANVDRQTRSIVTLQPHGELNPLFCLHGWGGDVYGFLDLAKNLAPDRPVYGLQAIGLDGRVPKHKTVEEMAEHYYNEIRATKPEGPYNLLGYSAGGWIAYAVAQLFEQRGEKVHLFMLDTAMSCKVPYFFYALAKANRIIGRVPHHFRIFWNKPSGQKLAYLKSRLGWLVVSLRRTGAPPPPAKDTVKVKAGPRPTPTASNDYFARVAGKYRPSRYNGDLVLFVAKGSSINKRLFWKYLIRGKVELHFVDGGHFGLIDGDNIGNFVSLFRKLIPDVDS
ncbi:MAG: amino acid adenylation domain-containing protein [Puniceicoccaceae bacterium]